MVLEAETVLKEAEKEKQSKQQGNILYAKVSVVGDRPLLWCHFGPEAIPLEKGEKTGVAGNDPEEWRKTVLATKDGHLYLEPSYIFGCIRNGSRNIKKGRGSIMPNVISTLQIIDQRILVDRWLPNGLTAPPPQDPEQPVYLDVRGVRNPATKAQNVRYRVASSLGWTCTFTIMWDKTVVSRGEMEASVIDAGRLHGLGSGRSIGFGRFSVEAFEVSNIYEG